MIGYRTGGALKNVRHFFEIPKFCFKKLKPLCLDYEGIIIKRELLPMTKFNDLEKDYIKTVESKFLQHNDKYIIEAKLVTNNVIKFSLNGSQVRSIKLRGKTKILVVTENKHSNDDIKELEKIIKKMIHMTLLKFI